MYICTKSLIFKSNTHPCIKQKKKQKKTCQIYTYYKPNTQMGNIKLHARYKMKANPKISTLYLTEIQRNPKKCEIAVYKGQQFSSNSFNLNKKSRMDLKYSENE